MNSHQYEKIMNTALNITLTEAGINTEDYTRVCLSADRTEYEVTMIDGSTRIINSGFDYFED